MAYQYTYIDVKDVTFTTNATRGSGGYAYTIQFYGNGTYTYEKDSRQMLVPGYLTVVAAHACCGSRAVNHMSSLLNCEAFGTTDFLKALTVELDKLFNGGNVSFILNNSQKKSFEETGILDRMDKIGQGLTLDALPFKNFNMDNTNYLYNWTFKGRQKVKKERIHEGDSQ